MRRKREPQFANEAELCAAFVRQTTKRRAGWTAYPETCGWDLLMVRGDGAQVGIQAKMRLNAEVINQALEEPLWYGACGPDYRAVLIPGDTNGDLEKVLHHLGINLIRCWQNGISNLLPDARFERDWHEALPLQRHPLPDYVPDVQAGVKSPIQLTDWKIKALKLCILLEHRGYLTRADFKRLHVDCRRWIAPGNRWLKATPQGFVADTHLPDFKAQHPRVWEQIKADPDKWLPIEIAA